MENHDPRLRAGQLRLWDPRLQVEERSGLETGRGGGGEAGGARALKGQRLQAVGQEAGTEAWRWGPSELLQRPAAAWPGGGPGAAGQ